MSEETASGPPDPAEPRTRSVVVVDYDPSWPRLFERLRERLQPALLGVAERIEHVGSTAVPGLAAKPVIDLVVIVPSPQHVPIAIERLASLGYRHRGDLGIPGREAFARPPDPPAHHLYVCPDGILALRNQLAVRDHLRAHPEAARAYGELKKQLARRFRSDIDGYVEGKTDFILGILREEGLGRAELDAIRGVNRRPPGAVD